MGLLDKAKNKEILEKSSWTDFLKEMNSTEKTTDFACILFRKFTEYFKIDKAAIFYKSKSGFAYDCLNSRGYDKTTGNRLRLNGRFINSEVYKQMKASRCIKNSANAEFLKDYMSTREHSLIKTINWLPFMIEEEIIALIMVSQWNGKLMENWNDNFNDFQKHFARDIYQSHEVMVSSQSDTRPSHLFAYLQDILTENHYIVKLDLNPLIEMLNETDSNQTNFKYKSEISSIIKKMLGPQQKVIDLENNSLLLILDKIRIPDKELLLSQLAISLPMLIPDFKETPRLDFQNFDYPDNDEKWERLKKVLP